MNRREEHEAPEIPKQGMNQFYQTPFHHGQPVRLTCGNRLPASFCQISLCLRVWNTRLAQSRVDRVSPLLACVGTCRAEEKASGEKEPSLWENKFVCLLVA